MQADRDREALGICWAFLSVLSALGGHKLAALEAGAVASKRMIKASGHR